MKLFYVYVDWTNEPKPRRFYVGKGTNDRITCVERNNLHSKIRKKYGFHRIAIFETTNEDLAYTVEYKLISLFRTYVHGGNGWWGANLDLGGRGGLGTPKQPEHREKIKQFMKTRIGNKNNFYGKKHSPETIESISMSMKGENGPCFGRTGSTHPMFGTTHSEASRQKMRLAKKPLTQLQIQRNLEGHQKRVQKIKQRDEEIMSLIHQGISNKEISEKLNIHLNLIYGARSRFKRNQK